MKTTKIIAALVAHLNDLGFTTEDLEEYDPENVPVAQVSLPGEGEPETEDSDPRLLAIRIFFKAHSQFVGATETGSSPGGATMQVFELDDHMVEVAYNADDNDDIVVAFYEGEDY